MAAAFRFPEASLGRGRLLYAGPVPVLRVEGVPEEVGRQTAELALRPAVRLLDYTFDLLADRLGSRLLARLVVPAVDRLGRRLLPRFPGAHRRELHGMASSLGEERRLIRGNTLFDLKDVRPSRLFGCSTMIAGSERTSTGGPLLARNLDFFPLGYLHEFGLVTVHRASGGRTRPFASIGFPGAVGVFSGMNDAGLTAVTHDVFLPNGRRFNVQGEPFACLCRRVLESCTTVREAEELFTSVERTTSVSVAVCDATDQAVFELSPEWVIRRDPDRNALTCTNHFVGCRRSNLGDRNPFNTVGRMERLTRAFEVERRIGVEEAWETLRDVSQGSLTIQAMVYEPARRAFHVALGEGPATLQEPTEIRLKDWL